MHLWGWMHHQWPCTLVYVSPDNTDLPDPSQGVRGGPVNNPHSFLLAIEVLAGRDNPAPLLGALASANFQGPAVSGTQRNTSSPPKEAGSVGLAHG